VKSNRSNRPPVLIESWLPVAELILASLLPPDTPRQWFLKTLGIFGDPVAARKRIAKAKLTGERLGDAYGYPRAFTYTPEESTLKQMFRRICAYWASDEIRVLDPMAGGGSIPFEAMRYGFTTYANELNPVAYVILKATLEYPAKFGEGLVEDIREYANMVGERARRELEPFFPKAEDEDIFAYIWARTVKCPECGLIVPLSPNWWLQKGSHPVAVRPIVPRSGNECRFTLLEGECLKGYDPDNGTVSRGTGQCPRCKATIDGDYIKSEAQRGRMGQQLYALAVKTARGKGFRLPNARDLEGVTLAEKELEKRLPAWIAAGLVPDSEIPSGHKTEEPRRSGMYQWKDLFSPRQLLAHLVYMQHILAAKEQARSELGPERAAAISTYLAFVLGKCLNYNSRICVWHPSRSCVANTFDRHDFSFKWTHGEFDASRMVWAWGTNQVVDAYKGAASLAAPSRTIFDAERTPRLRLTQGDAAGTRIAEPGSCHLICVDPPYYDNVMYAELSDFFYVWQKRVLGDIFPEAFQAELTEKDAEAVANPARFRGLKGARSLADKDYEAKMRACFENMHRQLRDDGVLTVMFTHKRVDAWDTLAAALIGAGFEMTASWPIHTESEHSLHQAKKNAAASTILLVCRKRQGGDRAAWWEDIIPKVQEVARQKAEEFEKAGIRGVDLYISTFGPVLQVLSAHWPVKNRKGELVRPDVALDEARRVVTRYRFERLCRTHSANLPVDQPTLWVILAWDMYRAAQFPFDEGRKLAISVGAGADIDTVLKRHHIVARRGSYIELVAPEKRQRRGHVDPNADTFPFLLDAIHTACVVCKEDGIGATRSFLARTNLHKDELFVAAVEAMLNALPPAIIHPGVAEKDRRGEWYLREIAQHILTGKVEVPTEEQLKLAFEQG